MKNVVRGTQETVRFARHLRTTQTDTEKILWKKLRAKRFCEYKFRRQVPIGPYIADFACMKRKVIVEVDGYVHEMKKSHDRERECFLRQHGFHILRLCNEYVRQNLEGILEKLLEFLSTPLPDPLPSGEGRKPPPYSADGALFPPPEGEGYPPDPYRGGSVRAGGEGYVL